VSSDPSQQTRKNTILPDDACPRCGTRMQETRGELTHPVNGQRIRVEDSPHQRCPSCGEVVLRFDEARQLREQHGSDRRPRRIIAADS